MKKIIDIFIRFLKWLSPGMEVKRWLFLSWLGLMIFAFGFLLLTNIRIPLNIELSIVDFFANKLKITVSSKLVDIFFVIIGLLIMAYAQHKWFRSIYAVIVPFEGKKLVEIIYEKRKLDVGYKLVAIGGGTGLSALLRGLKHYTSNITAMVTVSDDGGSSGRLRTEFGILPPGDIRNCLVALAKDESTLSSLFQYRFETGEGLEGHSFGNLFLTALNNIAQDDFQKAIKLSSEILSIQGKVFPATLQKTTLCAEMKSGEIICGESIIPEKSGEINRIFLKPENTTPLPEVLLAIKEADAIILGPGSLYTSILPNLQVPGIVEAIKESEALKLYICNVMTQTGETTGFNASQHLLALYKNSADKLVDVIIVNEEMPINLVEKYKAEGAFAVEPDISNLKKMNVGIITGQLLNENEQVRHDSAKLASIIVKTISENQKTKGGMWKNFVGKLEQKNNER